MFERRLARDEHWAKRTVLKQRYGWQKETHVFGTQKNERDERSTPSRQRARTFSRNILSA